MYKSCLLSFFFIQWHHNIDFVCAISRIVDYNDRQKYSSNDLTRTANCRTDDNIF